MSGRRRRQMQLRVEEARGACGGRDLTPHPGGLLASEDAPLPGLVQRDGSLALGVEDGRDPPEPADLGRVPPRGAYPAVRDHLLEPEERIEEGRLGEVLLIDHRADPAHPYEERGPTSQIPRHGRHVDDHLASETGPDRLQAQGIP